MVTLWGVSPRLLVLALTVTLVGFSGTVSRGWQVPQVDPAAVADALAQEESLGRLTVEVQGRVVVLRGPVSSLGAKNRAIELVLAVDGVDSVTSEVVVAEAESDEAIGELAVSLIRRYGFFSVYDDINLQVLGGAVQLTGQVTEPHKKIDVEKLVSFIGGVQAIDNQLEVLPVSGADDRLRRAIAAAIYTDRLFQKYAEVTSPPIHIIVKRGRVRLTGVVISNVEREFAAMIARQVDGVRSFRNELTVESQR
jgi:osmotically-inducible protein OsmY